MPGKGRRRAEDTRTTASRTLPLAWLLLLIAILGCGGLVRSPAPNAELEDLKRRVVELQRKTTVSEVELARLRQEVVRLEEELAAQEDAARRQQEQTAAEEAVVPIDFGGEIEEGDVEEEILDEPFMDRPPPEVPAGASEPPASPREQPREPPAGATPALAPPSAVTPQAQALYDESYTLFHEKRYTEAEEGFRRYLELYPTTELADNSQFWIGECRYARGDFNSALAAFTATVERFPGGNKVPDALLKAGKCLEALGDRERAAQTYREVMNRFRGSAAAAAAGQRLEALR
ncbi:MAG: tol-pal system protein YbgF [bacterium]|nr:tol-pal system protein YbgF [bacterium]